MSSVDYESLIVRIPDCKIHDVLKDRQTRSGRSRRDIVKYRIIDLLELLFLRKDPQVLLSLFLVGKVDENSVIKPAYECRIQ